MTAAFRKTEPRLALLEAVKDDRVWRHFPMFPAGSYAAVKPGQGEYASRRVTASIDVMERLGFVALLAPAEARYHEPRKYALTAAGKALLAEWSKP